MTYMLITLLLFFSRPCQWLETEGHGNRKPNKRGEMVVDSLGSLNVDTCNYFLEWTQVLLPAISHHRWKTYPYYEEENIICLRDFLQNSLNFSAENTEAVYFFCLTVHHSSSREKELAKVTIKKEDVELVVSYSRFFSIWSVDIKASHVFSSWTEVCGRIQNNTAHVVMKHLRICCFNSHQVVGRFFKIF